MTGGHFEYSKMIRKSFNIFDKGRRSANKFRKSQNLIFLDMQTFRKCGNLRICDMRTIKFLRFTDLRHQGNFQFVG